MLSRDPTYRGQVDPITADKRDRVIPATTLRKKVLLLDAARNNEPFRLEGDFLFADRDTTGVASIRLNSVAEDAWPISAQDGVVDIPIRDVFVTHAAQAGKVLNLWYGYRARLLAGANSIASIGSILTAINLAPVDARWYRFGDYETQQALAFIGGSPSAAVAGQVGFVQLFNPGASGVQVYVDDFSFWEGTAADRFELRVHNAALGAAVATKSNKLAGGAAAAAEVRFGASAAIPGTLIGVYAALANTLMARAPKAPILLPPGFGIHLNSFTANVSVGGTFEWRERTS